jgi:DNA-binding response OmpR family regulator
MRILVVEDEQAMADAIALGLTRSGYAVDTVYDGEEAIESVSENDYDLVVLDLNLPKVDGIDVCRFIRSTNAATGILMLTARSTTEERVFGLNAGADDYLIKPFHFTELLARVHAVLRRSSIVRQVILKCGRLTLDPNNMQVTYGDELLSLTTKEFGILEYLLINKDRIVSQEELLEHIWDNNADMFTQTVKVHINNLRKKLDSAGAVNLIQTIKNKGYLIKEVPDEETQTDR